MDVITRQAYLIHLVDAEGLDEAEANGFLGVLSRGLSESSPEAATLRDALEARMAAAGAFRGAALSLDRRVADAGFQREAAALLRTLSAASSSRATPARAQSLQDLAGRALASARKES
jgi:hypothetical protein